MGERQFGPYRLVKEIAVGGMAEIHLAKTSGVAGFEKFVALKMIHPNFSQDDQFIQMLVDEAKITVQLQHANIAQTFDLGRVGDTFYLTMEYVDGVDLFSLLREGAERELKMPFDVAAHIGRCVANGLDYAHRKRDVNGQPLGIVHRDVSPQNVLVSRAGEIKLVDFGIAKASHRARQTEAGVIKGKYYYMSPEQALAEQVDHRSDIFSVGILLHEMVTGQMLYMEDDLHKLLDRVRRVDIPAPSSIRSDLPPQLERIVMRALAPRPEDRFQSAGELSTQLGTFLHDHSPVFTATKVTSYIKEVFREENSAQAPAPPATRSESSSPSGDRMTQEQLLREPSEFYDENSVIFRVQDLVEPGGDERPNPPAPQAPSSKDAGFSRGANVSTRLLEAPPPMGLDDDEHTVISGPPEFAPEDDLHRGAPGPPASPARPAGSAPRPSKSASPQAEPPSTASAPGSERAAATSAAPSASPRAGSGAESGPPSPASGPPAGPGDSGSPGPVAPQPPEVPRSLSPDAVFGHPAPAGQSPAPGQPPPAPYPAPGQPAGDLSAPPYIPPQAADLSGQQAPSLAPARLRSPLAIAAISLLVVATIGAALSATILGNETSAPSERELRITSIPPGARVAIDGEPIEGETPLRYSSGIPGETHAFEFELEGYEPKTLEREVVPERGSSPIEIVANLKERRVELSVATHPSGGEVFLDGEPLGEAPVTERDIPVTSAKTLEVRLDGYESVERQLDWNDGASKDLEIELER